MGVIALPAALILAGGCEEEERDGLRDDVQERAAVHGCFYLRAGDDEAMQEWIDMLNQACADALDDDHHDGDDYGDPDEDDDDYDDDEIDDEYDEDY